jgi:hypothetical protein
MEEYSTDLGHWILLNNTIILAKKFKHRDQIKRGMPEMKIYPRNITRKNGVLLRRSQKLLTHYLKKRKNR